VLKAVEDVPGVVAHGFAGVGAGCGLKWDAREVGVQRGFSFGDLSVGLDAADESGEGAASGVDLGEAVGVASKDVEEGGLGHVVEVVGRSEAVCVDVPGGGVEGSAAEDPAVGAGVEFPGG